MAAEGKCIFNIPNLDGGNKFLALKEINNTLAISEEVIIAGKRQKVTKVMLYNQSWIERNLIIPMKKI